MQKRDKKKIVTIDELLEGSDQENKPTIIEEIREVFPETRTNSDLLGDKSLQLKWLVDGILLQGGSSLIVAEPKTGKSVFARQIAFAVAKGHKILNRKVKQGLVFYISVEDHPAIIKTHMQSMGAKDSDNIIWSLGRIEGKSFQEAIEFICKKTRPSLIVVDTMFKVFRTSDINDYNSMVESLQKVTEVVRKYNSHIMYIHHLNKGGYSNNNSRGNVSLDTAFKTPSLSRIMGSTGISGEVNNILFLARRGDSRYLDTSHSRCGDKIESELLYWNEEKGYYEINDI